MDLQLNPALDVEYLTKIYDNDATIVQIMFDAFLNDSAPRWKELDSIIDSGDYDKVASVAHSVKPSFSMVGLTWLHPKIAELEGNAKNNPEPARIRILYTEITEELSRMEPILRHEIERLATLL
jgi:HPt (histidine-containing phosphotransfer) domain-containing protein